MVRFPSISAPKLPTVTLPPVLAKGLSTTSSVLSGAASLTAGLAVSAARTALDLDRRERNHALAQQMWAAYATPILKGEALVEKMSIVETNKMLEKGGAHANVRDEGQGGSRIGELAFLDAAGNIGNVDFHTLSTEDRRVYRAMQKNSNRANRKEEKARKAEEKKVRAAEKAAHLANKEHLKLMKDEDAANAAAKAKAEEEMAKNNMSEEKRVEIMRLAEGFKKVLRQDKIVEKYGGARDFHARESGVARRDKTLLVVPKNPWQAYGFTEGVPNIKGVYTTADDFLPQREGREKAEEVNARKKQDELDAKQLQQNKLKEEAKQKRIRMKANGGVDPDERKKSRKELLAEQGLGLTKSEKREIRRKKLEEEGAAAAAASERKGSSSEDDDGASTSDDSDLSDLSVDLGETQSKDLFGKPMHAEEKSAQQKEAEELIAEFKRQAAETRIMLKKSGMMYSGSANKSCVCCGIKHPDRPIDYWTGLPKGGKANQWYFVGDQHFCYPCANNHALMQGVAKALALMNGLDPSEGVKNWEKVRKLKFRFNYDVTKSHEENKVNFVDEVVEEEKLPTAEELAEKQRRKDDRSALRDARFKKEEHMKDGKKNLWWQKKRRQEELIWTTDKIQEEGRKFEKQYFDETKHKVNSCDRKEPKIFGADHDAVEKWFGKDADKNRWNAPR